jgi:hypothetical protein
MTDAERIVRYESLGVVAIEGLRMFLANPQLSPGQRMAAQSALDAMFAFQETWPSHGPIPAHRTITHDTEWYHNGRRFSAGEYWVMRVGPPKLEVEF